MRIMASVLTCLVFMASTIPASAMPKLPDPITVAGVWRLRTTASGGDDCRVVFNVKPLVSQWGVSTVEGSFDADFKCLQKMLPEPKVSRDWTVKGPFWKIRGGGVFFRSGEKHIEMSRTGPFLMTTYAPRGPDQLILVRDGFQDDETVQAILKGLDREMAEMEAQRAKGEPTRAKMDSDCRNYASMTDQIACRQRNSIKRETMSVPRSESAPVSASALAWGFVLGVVGGLLAAAPFSRSRCRPGKES